MENYQGDLADIVRAGATADAAVPVPDWQFIPSDDPIKYYPEDFGDPFTYIGDPLLQNMDPPVPGFSYNNINIAQRVADNLEMERPSNIFSRMLQISPTQAKLPAVPPSDAPSSSKGCLVESTGLQISSPRNTGIKRRKSQARKVVCIPAPAPANSRASGEVVPSDLWAWRKYGQKPIKGSPFPRGYYRCSSSKGCSARKQVERSRTDPNMLVITYTSEHNHPWPTQRNALAGSTRSQPSKTNPCSSKTPPNPHDPQTPAANPKQEHKTENTVNPHSANVKLEEMDQELDNNQLEIDDAEFDEGFPAGAYKPTSAADSNQSEDSFFADLGEIEPDPLDILFTRGNKDLDPFVFYDWATNDTSITVTTASSTTSYGEAKQG
ncbi:probable WRKY transcription factor 14 [Phtheirospermum japonicum]|uniref:Probable WRKY transcription factor 14 n=1 Tax=Phtheirospermum japonicum TaxID=374723 RepID=A0A830BFX5_9LAMI|nr:probable WRKY transcription factor 14 [Phtheirospermum japonicum]